MSTADVAEKLNNLEVSIKGIPAQVSAEISIKLDNISSKLNSCMTKVDKLEEETHNKFKRLEIENNSLHKQLNRADIIVNGIPTKVKSKNLINVILGICKHYQISLQEPENNTVC